MTLNNLIVKRDIDYLDKIEYITITQLRKIN